MLIVVGGLPATGKTTLARLLASRTGAVHRDRGVRQPSDDHARCLVRRRDEGRGARGRGEVVCSDPEEHRRRVGSRSVDIPGLPLPTWQQIIDLE